MSARVAVVLDKAAALLERNGWCQGHYTRGKRHCVVGAIFAVDPHSVEPRAALMDVLGEPPGVWNDQPGRTAEQVISKLREVAALERAS